MSSFISSSGVPKWILFSQIFTFSNSVNALQLTKLGALSKFALPEGMSKPTRRRAKNEAPPSVGCEMLRVGFVEWGSPKDRNKGYYTQDQDGQGKKLTVGGREYEATFQFDESLPVYQESGSPFLWVRDPDYHLGKFMKNSSESEGYFIDLVPLKTGTVWIGFLDRRGRDQEGSEEISDQKFQSKVYDLTQELTGQALESFRAFEADFEESRKRFNGNLRTAKVHWTDKKTGTQTNLGDGRSYFHGKKDHLYQCRRKSEYDRGLRRTLTLGGPPESYLFRTEQERQKWGNTVDLAKTGTIVQVDQESKIALVRCDDGKIRPFRLDELQPSRLDEQRSSGEPSPSSGAGSSGDSASLCLPSSGRTSPSGLKEGNAPVTEEVAPVTEEVAPEPAVAVLEAAPQASIAPQEDDDDDNNCVICLDNEPDCVMVGCTHAIICKRCRPKSVAKELNKTSRKEIKAGSLQNNPTKLSTTPFACPLCRIESCCVPLEGSNIVPFSRQ